MNYLYRINIEAIRVNKPNDLTFGFDSLGDITDSDWIGNIYVLAINNMSAMVKFTSFLKENSQSWVSHSEVETVSNLKDYEMDYLAISKRKDLRKLSKGEVVCGWGM
jgi:hypothetical protein